MFKVNNRNTRTRCEICSELTIKTTERRLKVNNKNKGYEKVENYDEWDHWYYYLFKG